MKKVIASLILAVLVGCAHAEYQEQHMNDHQWLDIGFNKYFPHLYVFNKDSKMFFVAAGDEGNAAGSLSDFMYKLDNKKIARLEKHEPLPNHSDWEKKFRELSRLFSEGGFEELLKQGKLTIVGFVLSPDDFSHCGGCRTMYDALKTLGKDPRFNTVVVVQRKKASP